MSEVDKMLDAETTADCSVADAMPAGAECSKPMEKRADQNEEMPVWADAMMKRMDAMEARFGDKGNAAAEAPAVAADAPVMPADATEAEHNAGERAAGAAEEKDRIEREDAKAYADTAAAMQRTMQAKIAALEAQITKAVKPLSYEERNALSAARSYADAVYQRFGQHAPEPLAGENPIAYRKRLANGMQKHSPKFSKANLTPLDGEVFSTIESQIFADAVEASRNVSAHSPDVLMPIQTVENGLHFTRYAGRPSAWMAPFMAKPMGIKFNTNNRAS